MKSPITTHVLDTTQGKPAQGVPIILAHQSASGTWVNLAEGITDADGRVGTLLPADTILAPGIYRLTFNTAAYFQGQGLSGFYPYVPIVFEIKEPDQHYHVPLLLNPYGYATYRGS